MRGIAQVVNPIEEGLEGKVPANEKGEEEEEEDADKGLYEAVEDRLYEDIEDREEKRDSENQAFAVQTLRADAPDVDVVGMSGEGFLRRNIGMVHMDEMSLGRERGGSGEELYRVKEKKDDEKMPWEQKDDKLKKYRP